MGIKAIVLFYRIDGHLRRDGGAELFCEKAGPKRLSLAGGVEPAQGGRRMEIRGIRLGRSGNQGRCIFLPYYAPCFVATDQESKLGQFALITSAVSLVSYWACGKWFKPKFRKTGMLVGSILIAGHFTALVAVNYTTLVLGIGTSLFIPLYMMPAISASFDLMGVNQENVEKRVELVVCGSSV